MSSKPIAYMMCVAGGWRVFCVRAQNYVVGSTSLRVLSSSYKEARTR